MAAAPKGKWLIVENKYNESYFFEGTRKQFEAELLEYARDTADVTVYDMSSARVLGVQLVTEPSVIVNYGG